VLLQFVGVPLELLIGALKRLLEVCPGSDVDDRGENERTTSRSHRRQADLRRELRAIAPASGQLQPAAHRTRAGMEAILGPPRGVLLGEARRNETLDRRSTELLG
jgi:hypothetical protein